MPKITDFRKTKSISFPSYPDSEVVIYSGILFGQAMDIDLSDKEKYIMKALPKFIQSWNFTNENNEALPIDLTSLGKFSADDIAFLITEITKFITEEKKTV